MCVFRNICLNQLASNGMHWLYTKMNLPKILLSLWVAIVRYGYTNVEDKFRERWLTVPGLWLAPCGNAGNLAYSVVFLTLIPGSNFGMLIVSGHCVGGVQSILEEKWYLTLKGKWRERILKVMVSIYIFRLLSSYIAERSSLTQILALVYSMLPK